MSELKAVHAFDVYESYTKTGDDDAAKVYLKSEADKVIALLKDKANYNEYAYKRKSEEFADTCRFYEDELRHHKYKRCLAMAKWCLKEYLNCNKYKITFWLKWRRRWLELAEQFKDKEAK